MAHGVGVCAAGLRYVLYLYVTALDDPTQVIAEPAGILHGTVRAASAWATFRTYFSATAGCADPDGRVLIYYASCDTRMHVAVWSIDRLLDYCFNTAPDGFRSATSGGKHSAD